MLVIEYERCLYINTVNQKKGGAPLFGVSRFVPRFARVGAWDGSGALVRDGTVIDKVCDASKEMTMTVEIAVQDVEGARIAHEAVSYTHLTLPTNSRG